MTATCLFPFTLFCIPTPRHHVLNRESSMVKGSFSKVLANSRLLKLNFGIMCVHILLMSSFVALPPLMEEAGLARDNQWKVYLVTMLIAFVCVIPFIIYAEKQRRMKQVFQVCVILMLAAEVILWYADLHLWGIIFGVQVFFIAFNVMEALLPSLISKESPAGYKGTAMGIYSTSQFLGVAIGGSLGGFLYSHNGAATVFTGCAVLAVIWLAVSMTMKEPPYVSSLRIVIPDTIPATPSLELALKQLHGVADVVLIPEEKTAYVKIDSKITNRGDIELFVAGQH